MDHGLETRGYEGLSVETVRWSEKNSVYWRRCRTKSMLWSKNLEAESGGVMRGTSNMEGF